jgi:hypothetical protein
MSKATKAKKVKRAKDQVHVGIAYNDSTRGFVSWADYMTLSVTLDDPDVRPSLHLHTDGYQGPGVLIEVGELLAALAHVIATKPRPRFEPVVSLPGDTEVVIVGRGKEGAQS